MMTFFTLGAHAPVIRLGLQHAPLSPGPFRDRKRAAAVHVFGEEGLGLVVAHGLGRDLGIDDGGPVRGRVCRNGP
jgi:hypothetical protein